MITRQEPVTALVNAALRSLDGCTRDESFEILRAAEFHHQVREKQIRFLLGHIENVSPRVVTAISDALLESGEQLPLHERRIYQDFQRIVLDSWIKCEWDEMEGILRVDEREYRIPQSSSVYARGIHTHCVGLEPEEVDQVRAYICANEGPWNFVGSVRDFRRSDGVVWAMDWSGERIVAIQPEISPGQFLRKYSRQIDGLSAEEQKTLLFALTDSEGLLLKRHYEFTFQGSARDTGVVIASYLDGRERKYVLLTRQQTSADFLRDLPISSFEFALSQENVYEDLIEYVMSHKGPWNQKGVVIGFFEDVHGAVRCRLVDDSSAIIPINISFATFMTTYVDDNPRISQSGKALINRLSETIKFDFVRGSIKSIFGSREHGVLVEGHDGQIIRAFFDEWKDPLGEISADPLLSGRAKQLVAGDIAENPRLPDWRCLGYVSRIREDQSGVEIVRYDGTSRRIPFSAAG